MLVLYTKLFCDHKKLGQNLYTKLQGYLLFTQNHITISHVLYYEGKILLQLEIPRIFSNTIMKGRASPFFFFLI